MRKKAAVRHSTGKKYKENMNNRNSISTLFFKSSTELIKDVVAEPSTQIASSSNHIHVKQQLT